MDDPLHDYVKALLDQDYGDERILKQILRAYENSEVISNSERDYIERMAEKYLGKKRPILPVETPPPKTAVPQATQTQNIPIYGTEPKITPARRRHTKLMLILGAIALLVIGSIAVSLSGGLSGTPDITTGVPNVTGNDPDPNVSLSIKSDLPSYDAKDLILISGVSDNLDTVTLSIQNHDSKLIWTEEVSVRDDRRYSTLVIAGGQGWEESGTFSLHVDNGDETKTSTFSFTS